MSQASEIPPEFVEQFRLFVARADALREPTADSSSASAFRSFVSRATPLVLEPAQELLTHVADHLRCLSDFLIPSEHDLLYVAGLEYAEDAYTELMRWAMDPQIHPRIAVACQRRWLNALGIAEHISIPATPQTQVGTVNGVPDLVMLYDRFVVIVEAKTGSSEHGARGGDIPQTLAYPPAVRAKLNLPASFPTYMIFLTPDRSAAANENAYLATYLGFSMVLAGAVAEFVGELSGELRWPYAAVITHLATRAVPGECDVRRVRELHQSRCENRLSDAELLMQFHGTKSVYDLMRSS